MATDSLDPARGAFAAVKLKALRAHKVLVRAAEEGRITQVACKMPECYCPEELGGATFFQINADPQTDWMPTPDHYPTMKMNGGKLSTDNVRLAHKLCNRIDYSKQIDRPYKRDLARVEAAREGRAVRSRADKNE
jgi:hypothetical protein